MTLTSKIWLLIPVFIALSACSLFESEQTSRLCADDNGNFTTCRDMLVIKQEFKQHASLFASDLNFVQLSDYTQQIALELKNHMPIMGLDGSVIVTPFVKNNGLIEEADDLGYDLAEYVSHDLRGLGVSTSDHSLNTYLYRTENGAIEFSLEQQEVFQELNASYVLAGNMRQTSSGLMVNAKIIELKSGRLMASSAKLLPNLVMNNIL